MNVGRSEMYDDKSSLKHRRSGRAGDTTGPRTRAEGRQVTTSALTEFEEALDHPPLHVPRRRYNRTTAATTQRLCEERPYSKKPSGVVWKDLRKTLRKSTRSRN